MGVGSPRRFYNLKIRCSDLPVRYVLPNCSGEQERVLWDEGYRLPKRIQLPFIDWISIDGYPPGTRLIKPQEKVDHRRLSRAAAANDGDSLPRSNVQAKVPQDALGVGVAERDSVEFYVPSNILRVDASL